jgi:dethiobiotin synthetase
VRTRYRDVNPYAFVPAIAPHIAALEAGVDIDSVVLERAYERLALVSDIVVVEGAGGWLTPINRRQTLADLALALDARVVLVVGMRLGCLNHALLTARAIEGAGLSCVGWIANQIDPAFERLEENIRTLQLRLSAPKLGRVSHDAALSLSDVAASLAIEPLL